MQDLHDNASLNVQLLQKEIFDAFSKSLPSSTNLETLPEQLADQLSGLDPRGWLRSIIHSIRSEIVMLIIVLMVICRLYRCLSTKIVQSKQTHLVRTFFNKVSTVTPNYEKIKKGGIVRGRSTLRKPICCTFLPLCAISQGFSVSYQFLFQE